MDVQASGKVALVTGAARRVGRAIALELADAGFDLAIHYHNSQAEAELVLERAVELGRRAILVRGDLEQPDTPQRLVDSVVGGLGSLDVLVNSASSFHRVMLEQTDAREWGRSFALNAVAPALLSRAAAPVMRSRGRGRIVNLIDIMAERAVRGYAAYIASKAALAAITRGLALELAPDITVNGISPGIAEFPEHYDASTRERLIARVPLKRAGSPEEVAALVRFLVTECDYISGAIIPIDGGRSIMA